MAKPINLTPILKGEDAERFIEYINRPATEQEKEYGKECDEIFKKVKFIH